MKTSAQLKAEINEIRTKYDAIFARDQITDGDADELRAMDATLETLIADYSKASQEEQRTKSNRDALTALFSGGETAAPTDDGDRTAAQPVATGSMGDRFVNDPEFKAWHAQMTGGGTREISKNVGIKSPTITMDAPLYDMKAAILTGLSSTSAGALVVNDRTNILVPARRDDLRVVDLLTRMSTTSDVVEFVRVGTETNNAAPVLEATTIDHATIGVKPASETALAVVSEIVETIAHIMYVTRRAVSDAGQLRAYIDDFMMWGLMDVLNDQIINGTGTTPQLRGLDDLSGTQSQAFDTNMITTTRKARTLVKTVGGATPTAFVMTPENWEAIDLATDNENRYYFGGPAGLGTPVLWGLPVVEEEALAANQAFVGDWRMGIIFDREQAQMFITDSNRDLFERNILTLLAELRAAIAWLRPAAFVEIAMA